MPRAIPGRTVPGPDHGPGRARPDADGRCCRQDCRAARRQPAAGRLLLRNDLALLADFDAPKRDFERQVRAVKAVALPSQLYKTSLDAIAKLAREKGDRKALIILGDGQSDDTADEHDQVVKAAREAGVSSMPWASWERRPICPSSRACGGWPTTPAASAGRSGSARRNVYAVGNQFIAEALENGGSPEDDPQGAARLRSRHHHRQPGRRPLGKHRPHLHAGGSSARPTAGATAPAAEPGRPHRPRKRAGRRGLV